MNPGEIIIKDTEVFRGIFERRFAPILINIILFIAKTYGLVITESYREKRHMGDLHGTQPVRAIDLRSWAYEDTTAQEIKHTINRMWEYDYTRPDKHCALLHRVGAGGMHFHIQVHPNTRRRAI